MSFFFFKHKTAYEMRISDWSSDVCSSDLPHVDPRLSYLSLEPVEQSFIGLIGKGGEAQRTAKLVRTLDQGDVMPLDVEPARCFHTRRAASDHNDPLGGGLDGCTQIFEARLDRKRTRLNSSH